MAKAGDDNSIDKVEERRAKAIWYRLNDAAWKHAGVLVASFAAAPDRRWLPLSEGYKLLHPLSVEGAIVAWAEDRCRQINGSMTRWTRTGEIIHPPPLDDVGNPALPNERELKPFLERYVRGATVQGLVTVRALTRDDLVKGEEPRVIAAERCQALKFDFARSHASLDGETVLFCVEVALAAPYDEANHIRGAGSWIATEAKRMKAAGEIREGIRITEFAQKLAHQMGAAAKTNHTIKAIKAPSIKNRLRNWGLWPVSSIK